MRTFDGDDGANLKQQGREWSRAYACAHKCARTHTSATPVAHARACIATPPPYVSRVTGIAFALVIAAASCKGNPTPILHAANGEAPPAGGVAPANAPAPGDWPFPGRDPEGTRFSPLTQITADNVKTLEWRGLFLPGTHGASRDSPSWSITPCTSCPPTPIPFTHSTSRKPVGRPSGCTSLPRPLRRKARRAATSSTGARPTRTARWSSIASTTIPSPSTRALAQPRGIRSSTQSTRARP